jgi:hypothetical protein
MPCQRVNFFSYAFLKWRVCCVEGATGNGTLRGGSVGRFPCNAGQAPVCLFVCILVVDDADKNFTIWRRMMGCKWITTRKVFWRKGRGLITDTVLSHIISDAGEEHERSVWIVACWPRCDRGFFRIQVKTGTLWDNLLVKFRNGHLEDRWNFCGPASDL